MKLPRDPEARRLALKEFNERSKLRRLDLNVRQVIGGASRLVKGLESVFAQIDQIRQRAS